MPDIVIPDLIKPPKVPGMLAAELVIDGLSVFCFNKTEAERFWEIAFPRQAQHKLKFTIQQLDVAGKPVGAEMPKTIPDHVERFTIRLTKGSTEHYQQNHFPEGGPKTAGAFNRNNPANKPHDLRWMIDLAGSELGHGPFEGLKPRSNARLRSIASIRHSLFCNLEPETKPARISPLRRNHPCGNGRFDLGHINTLLVGVMLGTTPGQIEFEFDPPSTTIDPLEYNETTRYRIDIRNEDSQDHPKIGDFVRGDLRLLYDELIDVGGELKDLWAIPNEERFSPDGDCHGTTISIETFGP